MSAAFPWWLWLLSGLWTGAVVVTASLPPRSEARRVMGLMVWVYTGLLAYIAARSALPGARAAEGLDLRTIAALLAGGVALAGGLIGLLATDEPWSRRGTSLAVAGLAGVAAAWSAWELMVLLLAAAGLASIDPIVNPSKRTARTPDRWAIAVAGCLATVLWLGVASFALRVEADRTAPSRWATALPSPALVARQLKSASSNIVGSSLTWGWLVLGAAVVWAHLGAARRPADAATPVTVGPGYRDNSSRVIEEPV